MSAAAVASTRPARRLGLFGGSFDPIHSGHILPVREARLALGLERVVYLPTARPPHKGARFAPPLQRWTMVELALLDEPGLEASPLELTPENPAYTIDTLQHFARREPDAELHLIVGADSFADLPLWRRWQHILALARLIVLVRPGWEEQALRAAAPAELAAAVESSRAVFVANTPVPVSSTELREIFARGGTPPAGTVPEPVVKYIRKYGLYR
jgi:nicotinate-nucleotide adenylyltransferase